MDSKPQFHERIWDYSSGYSTGSVTAAEIRRAPYHQRIRKHGSDTKDLAAIDLRDLHSRDWHSKVIVYDFQRGFRLPKPETCDVSYSGAGSEYRTWELEELRSRVLQSSVVPSARLVIAENVIPPVVEILGSSLQIEPELFGRHIGNAWGNRSASIQTASSRLFGSREMWLEVSMRYPRLVAVSHPSALKRGHSDWREQCLTRAARFLQCRQLLPILDTVENDKIDKVQCIAFEHITVQIADLIPGSRGSASEGWRGLVLFPNSVNDWQDRNMKVERYQIPEPRAKIETMKDLLHASREASEDADVDNWLAAMRVSNVDGDGALSPLTILWYLWCEVRDKWHVHLAQMAQVMAILSTGSEASLNEYELRRYQQLRAVLVQDSSTLAEIDDSLQETSRLQSVLNHDNEATGPWLESLRKEFEHVKTQLERHLPTLQHYLDIVTQAQQVKLAETQLEESRKAIQQADTIKRLTILAFIYIPIQTASSIFGMNVKELGHEPSVWIFVLVALVLLVMTVCAAGWQHVVNFLYRQLNKMFGSFRHTLRRSLAAVGINAEGLQRADDLDTRRRTPEPSWYHEPPWS